MKKTFLFLFFVFTMFAYAYSQPVSVQTAQSIANKVLQQASQSSGVQRAPSQPLQLVYQAEPSQPTVQPSFYVFSGNNSFVIVSGDSRAMPVLGYSENSSFDVDNIPPNVAWWLSEYAKQIEFVVQNDIAPSQEVDSEWTKVQQTGIVASASSANAVSPLLSTTWNQGSPYNNLCPQWSGNKSVTGCVATAMAQIMKYHKTPNSRTITIPGYTTSTRGITIPSITGSTSYDWDNMANSYSSGTADINNAVATLMYHCGVSVNMDYYDANGESGAQTSKVATALSTYFGYDAGVRLKQRNYCNTNDWHNILRTELDEGRPVCYSGRYTNPNQTSGGHAFVCDGYDVNNYFYFNWGWGGLYNGKFLTSALNPGSGGTGSGSGTYNEDQTIIYNIKPNAGGTSAGTYELGIQTTFTSTAISVNYNESFTINLDIANISAITFPIGQVGVALVDNSGNIVSVLQSFDINYDLQAGYYFTSIWDYPCSVPSSIPAGIYTLRAVANTNPSDGNGWYLVAAKSDGTGALEIAVASGCLTPTAIQASNVSDNEATITWTPVGSETQWDFQYSTDPAFAGATTETLSLSSKNLTGLISGTAYYVRVRAICTGSNSNWKTGSFITALCELADQVTYTIVSYDDYGDGWNGNSLTIKQSGTDVAIIANKDLDGIQLSKEDNTHTVSLCSCMPFEVVWNGRTNSWPEECSFVIKNNLNQTIFTSLSGDNYVNGQTVFSGTTNCIVTWTPQSSSTAWNNSTNWTPQSVPSATNRAIIPKSASYPVLTAPTTVGEILFEPGAELGRQDYLTYEKAFVQLDFSDPDSRGRWWMLTNPLQELFAGDFSFGGLPGIDMKAFVTETDQNDHEGEGVWKSLSGYGHKLGAGDDFQIWLEPDHPTETTKGLRHPNANGIITLPHFEDPGAANVHWTHEHNPATHESAFYGWTEQYERSANPPVSVTRDMGKAYKLTSVNTGSFKATLDFGKGKSKESWFAATGNPFMSSISFNNLLQDNTFIGENYWVWVGAGVNNATKAGSYAIWNKTAGTLGNTEVTLSDALAPMQSFIVERIGESGTQITFNIANISVTGQNGNSGLRASAQPSDLLEIIASTPQSAVRAAIASHENGSPVFNRKDSRKFSAGINSLPDIYMLKPAANNSMVAVTANILNEIKEEITVPLAISTTYEGPVTLSFAGMDTYNARIFFIDTDAQNKKENELTGQARYEYTFNYVPKKVNGTVAANENRFLIRLSPTNQTGIGLATPNNILIYNRQANTIQVVSGELIQHLSVFDLQGRKIYDNASVNAYEHTVTGLAPGVYVVKATSKQEVKTMKIIVK